MKIVENSWLNDLLILTLLIGTVFGFFLGNRPLAVPDEARYSEVPREMVQSGDYITPHLNSIKYFEKPAFFYWLQAAAIKLFGSNEWSTRLITALMGLLGSLMTYAVARKLYNRRTGFLASLILASSILYFTLAHFITIDMTLTALLSASLFSFLLGVAAPLGKKRRIFFWSMYVFSAFATLTKGLIGVIFPGAIIFCWVLIFNDWRNLKNYYIPSGLLLWLIVTLPWHVLAQWRNPEFFHFYIIEQQFARYFTNYAHRSQALWYLPGFLILGFFPWIAFLPQTIQYNWPSSWKKRFNYKNEIFLLLWAVIIYVFFQVSHSQLPPYILPIFPPLAILTANYFSTEWETSHSKGIWSGLITIGILVLLTMVIGCVAIYYTDMIPPTVDWLWISVSAILLLLTCIVAILSYIFDSFKATFISLTAGMLLFLLSLNISSNGFQDKSIKSLALAIKPILGSQDQVLSYHGYYQDLPFYLERRVIVVGWATQELEFGMKHQPMDQWLIDDKTLWDKWQGPTRLFLFMSRRDYNSLLKEKERLKQHHARPLYVVAQTARDVLISNRGE